MPTDTERREVARRLRHAWVNVPDTNRVRHHLRVLYEVYEAVGISDDDDADAIDLFDRLADLIEPSEPKVERVVEVKIDGERLERLAYDEAVELTGVDRDALLELADEMERSANETMAYFANFNNRDVIEYARRIRKACGADE